MKQFLLSSVLMTSISSSFAKGYSGTDVLGLCPEGLRNNTTYLSDYIFADVQTPSHMDLELVVLTRHERARIHVVGGERVKDIDELDCSQPEAEGLRKLGLNGVTHNVFGMSSGFTGIYKVCVTDFSGKIIEVANLCNSETGD